MRKLLTVVVLLASSGFASASSPTQPPPSITVTGNGKVVYVPDIGYIHFGVSSNGSTAAEAWKKNAEIVKKIFDELKKQGIEDKDLKTSNISVVPRYEYKKDLPPKFLGYTVSYDLNVTVRKLDQMGDLLDTAVEAGANTNVSISFGCSKIDELVDEARLKAVTEARKKANLYVTGAGAKLGDVLGISDTPYAPMYPRYQVEAMTLKDAKASLPVMAGEQELNITLTVTWEIDNSKLPPG
jgi:uncharacterized protein YggE